MTNPKQTSTSFYQNEVINLQEGRYVTSISDWSRWNQYFPYKLIIVSKKDQSEKSGFVKIKEFVLPISPQELNISMPFASTLTPTLGGVVEQNNGSIFRDISIQGTTGVNIVKNSAYSPYGDVKILSALLPRLTGSVNSYSNVSSVFNAFGPNSIYNKDTLAQSPEDETAIYRKSTGYYQFLALRSFLEYYAELKKNNTEVKNIDARFTIPGDALGAKTKDVRLVLAIDKENDWYLCSAVNFSVKRSSQDPYMYQYSLNLRSFRRIERQVLEDEGQSTVLSATDLNKSLTRLKDGAYKLGNVGLKALGMPEQISEALRSIPGQVASQVQDILSKANLAVRGGKDVLNLSDLPKSLQEKVSDSWNLGIGDISKSLSTSGPRGVSGLNSGISKENPRNRASYEKNSLLSNKSGTKDVSLNNLGAPIPTYLQNEINRTVTEARNQTSSDYKKAASVIQNACDSVAYSSGSLPDSYARTYNLKANQDSAEITIDDFELGVSLIAAKELLYALAARAPQKSDELPSTMEYIAGFANASGIAFRVPVSKFPVPFPYGSTLERLAQSYLGDAGRWHEIATLNGLKAPFVDEEGWSFELLANGNANNIAVPVSDVFFLGQTVWLYSNVQYREKRRITNIQKTGNMMMLSLSGEQDLQKFKKNDVAKLEGFLPNTVNSQQMIFIPSTKVLEEQGSFDVIPEVDRFDPLIQSAGSDLLLDNDGDLILTPDGGTKLAYGLQMIVQQVKIALSTEKGTILQHPSYGTGLKVGLSTADVLPGQVLEDIKAMFNSDDVFTGVSSLSVAKNGNSMSVSIVLGIRGLGKEVPLTFLV